MFALAEEHARRIPAAPAEYTLDLGGPVLRLRFLSESVARLFVPALIGLEPRPAAAASLAISLVDSAAAGLPPPPGWPLPIGAAGYGRRYWAEGGRSAHFENVGRSWTLLDRRAGTGYFWTADAARMPLWEWAEPLRILFGWSLADAGLVPLHAGAVGDARGALVAVGPGGSGKSSTVLACAGRLPLLGDDFVLLDARRRRVRALYATAKLDAAGLARFPALAVATINPMRAADEKAVFRLDRVPGLALARDLPIAALVLPQVTGARRTRFTPARAADALRALAPSSMLLVPGAHRAAMSCFAEIVATVPSFHAELGSEPAEIAAAMDALLSETDLRQDSRRRTD